jgi:hypothetical protein
VVGRHITDWGADVVGDLHPGVDTHEVWFAIEHAIPLQNVDSVLALVKEEALRAAFHGNPQEVMEKARSFITNSRCREVIMH